MRDNSKETLRTKYQSDDFKKKTVDQAIETIRNRIDEFGVAEPSISAQGTNRILVQLPGKDLDVAKAKDLINSEELKKRMTEGGVKSEPVLTVFKVPMP